jgi:hypothetical protein
MLVKQLFSYPFGLFKIIKAAIVPGTHPQSHKINTITIEPQPLSNTDNGGKIIANNTLHILMIFFNLMIDDAYRTQNRCKCYINAVFTQL